MKKLTQEQRPTIDYMSVEVAIHLLTSMTSHLEKISRDIEIIKKEMLINPAKKTQTAPVDLGVCPDCGKPFVLRTNKNNGQQFLGCSGYPVCKTYKQIK